jgi:hypothetical protein
MKGMKLAKDVLLLRGYYAGLSVKKQKERNTVKPSGKRLHPFHIAFALTTVYGLAFFPDISPISNNLFRYSFTLTGNLVFFLCFLRAFYDKEEEDTTVDKTKRMWDERFHHYVIINQI